MTTSQTAPRPTQPALKLPDGPPDHVTVSGVTGWRPTFAIVFSLDHFVLGQDASRYVPDETKRAMLGGLGVVVEQKKKQIYDWVLKTFKSEKFADYIANHYVGDRFRSWLLEIDKRLGQAATAQERVDSFDAQLSYLDEQIRKFNILPLPVLDKKPSFVDPLSQKIVESAIPENYDALAAAASSSGVKVIPDPPFADPTIREPLRRDIEQRLATDALLTGIKRGVFLSASGGGGYFDPLGRDNADLFVNAEVSVKLGQNRADRFENRQLALALGLGYNGRAYTFVGLDLPLPIWQELAISTAYRWYDGLDGFVIKADYRFPAFDLRRLLGR